MARYTLTMPDKIMEELKAKAEEHDCNIKDIVRQCLQFGLIGMEIAKDDSKKLVIEADGEDKKELYFLL